MKRTLREDTPHNLILEYPNLDLLCETQSEYQHIAVYVHRELGKILVHDGVVMLAEAYEAAYHEMLVHVPLLYHPSPQRVLVVGGGDGGTSREVLRHPQVQQFVQVEIDAEVVRLCREHFPRLASCYDDTRMELRLGGVSGDGVQYMAACAAGQYPPFDIILVDSTDPPSDPNDPSCPAAGLFTESFYRACQQSLRPNGILVIQGETFYGMAGFQKQILQILRQYFRAYGMYTSAIPFYPLGTWNLIYASDRPRGEWQLREEALQKLASEGLEYLNREIITACFALPNYALRLTGLDKGVFN